MFLKVYLDLAQGHLPVTFHLSQCWLVPAWVWYPLVLTMRAVLFNWPDQPTKGEYHAKPGWGGIRVTIPRWKETWCSSRYSLP